MPPTQTVRIVNRDNSDTFGAQRMEMFAARKQVFIDGLKWDLATTDGLYEIDEYDHADTVYLIVADAVSGSHLGSVRLLPTDGPHLLGDKFASLCEDGVPRAADVHEITRLVTRPGLPRDEAKQVRQMLAVAVFEYAMAHDIRHFTMMTHMVFLSAVIGMGWNCEPLGLPQEMDGVEVGALRIDVDAESLARLRAHTNVVDPILVIDLTESALVD
jgi:N-acyl-L-homoserine lactone synthetase